MYMLIAQLDHKEIQLNNLLEPGGQAPGCGKCCLHQPGGQSRGEQAFSEQDVQELFIQAEVMRENLNYYLALPSVVKEDLVDLEAKVGKCA